MYFIGNYNVLGLQWIKKAFLIERKPEVAFYVYCKIHMHRLAGTR